ncbi:hypothetical protein ZIOFF_007767 [Zingiber officinale]|uniref:TRF2/HOY1 PH-like domain-containing protein n=1 Tax=Zingiber officinale TaxID=94328 RepID=A0A8J5I285_ZINOF|nr:hypothetical protein ZIOFF_007767 [Zingiber officinale]
MEICTSMPPTDVLMQHNLPNQSGPLGLRLPKSPSFLELLQVLLSQQHDATVNSFHDNNAITKEEVEKKETKPTACAGAVATIEKMKASNFPASLLKIGTWEYASRYEGDLVAKCYFAKRKLVWEILKGGLKSKIEIQWSDIASLRALCPEDGPATLDVVLSRQPLFFREINPQPRKHTVWQATTDFTEGQASLHRQHFLQCPQALLGKHLEKIMQFDPRLRLLSQEQDFALENPYFESKCSVFEDLDNSKHHSFGILNDKLHDAAIHCVDEPSASLDNFVDQTGEQYISKADMDELVQTLFSDCQTPASDEKLIMSKVDSLCCLLQNEERSSANQSNDAYDGNISTEWEFNNNDGSINTTSMSTEISGREMMMHLPHMFPTMWLPYDDNLQEDNEYERFILK